MPKKSAAPLDAAIARALDLFSEVRSVRARKMFGAAGIYAGAKMFAIVTENAIFLKADDDSRDEFKAAKSSPFSYTPPGSAKSVTMNFWTLPTEALDDETLALAWAHKAIASAERSQGPAARRGPRGEKF